MKIPVVIVVVMAVQMVQRRILAVKFVERNRVQILIAATKNQTSVRYFFREDLKTRNSSKRMERLHLARGLNHQKMVFPSRRYCIVIVFKYTTLRSLRWRNITLVGRLTFGSNFSDSYLIFILFNVY